MSVVRVFITGRPGVGKTTVFMKTVSMLRERGLRVSGFYCPEVREGGRRIGFRIVDIETGAWGWLAVVEGLSERPCLKRVGRYCLVEEDAVRVSRGVSERIPYADIAAIDEIGPMELSIPPLREIIYSVLERAPRGLYVVHERIVGDLGRRFSARIYRVDEQNRDRIHLEVYKSVLGER